MTLFSFVRKGVAHDGMYPVSIVCKGIATEIKRFF